MSIAVLTQVYDETRRLAIAGSGLAGGDFRLKKLVPPLRKSAEKAPVFGKVADAVERVTDGPPNESADALLELSTLVNAILYTQGETGKDGELEPITTGTAELTQTNTSARVLKPLIEALTSTGSGRLEIIRDAHGRGAFKDLRLVQLALNAIDDPYPDIGEFIAFDVLPSFGKSVYPELRESFDPQGRGNSVRRLKLMHQLEPVKTLPLVREVLENGSKEVKIAALTCLNNSKEDLPLLLDQVNARSKDVRQAALEGMAGFDDDAVVDALIKALDGGDREIAVDPAAKCPSPRLLKHLLEDGKVQLEALFTTKDKKQLAIRLQRFQSFLSCFAGRTDKQTIAFLSECFDRREQIGKLKGQVDGDDVNSKVTALLVLTQSKPAMKTVVEARDTLGPSTIDYSFIAATQIKKPKEVFDLFSPYLLPESALKKRGRDLAGEKSEVLADLLQMMQNAYWRHWNRSGVMTIYTLLADVKLDPRWLDKAVEIKNTELIAVLIRPGHAEANAYLLREFEDRIKKRDGQYEVSDLLHTMIQAQHPDVVNCFVRTLEKFTGKSQRYYYTYWLNRLIPELPKEAVPRITELLPALPERVVDDMVPFLDELRAKA